MSDAIDARQLIQNKRKRLDEFDRHHTSYKQNSNQDIASVDKSIKCDDSNHKDNISRNRNVLRDSKLDSKSYFKENNSNGFKEKGDIKVERLEVADTVRANRSKHEDVTLPLEIKTNCNEDGSDNLEEGEIVEKPVVDRRTSTRQLRSQTNLVRNASEDMLRTCIPIPMSSLKKEKHSQPVKTKIETENKLIEQPILNSFTAKEEIQDVKAEPEKVEIKTDANNVLLNVESNPPPKDDVKMEESGENSQSNQPQENDDKLEVKNVEQLFDEAPKHTEILETPLEEVNVKCDKPSPPEVISTPIESVEVPQNLNVANEESKKNIENIDNIVDNNNTNVKAENSPEKSENSLNMSVAKSITNISTNSTDYKIIEDENDEITVFVTRKKRKKKKVVPAS